MKDHARKDEAPTSLVLVDHVAEPVFSADATSAELMAEDIYSNNDGNNNKEELFKNTQGVEETNVRKGRKILSAEPMHFDSPRSAKSLNAAYYL